MTFPTEWKVIKFHGSKPPTRVYPTVFPQFIIFPQEQDAGRSAAFFVITCLNFTSFISQDQQKQFLSMMAICSHDHCCPPLPLLSYNSAHLSLVSTVVSFGHQFVNNDSHSFGKKTSSPRFLGGLSPFLSTPGSPKSRYHDTCASNLILPITRAPDHPVVDDANGLDKLTWMITCLGRSAE